jgi:predicted TIM-barrel fold metal-dependent hydrolase
MVDIHNHFGQFGNQKYSPNKVLSDLMKLEVAKIGLMPLLSKKGDNLLESHRIMAELLSNYKNLIIPILWVHPLTSLTTILRFLNEVPYKIIKIHGYLHNWDEHIFKLNQIIGLAKERKMPIMFHTGGRKESYAYKYKTVCSSNLENKFILAHSRPILGTINVMKSCANVYCDTAFTPIEDIKLLIKNEVEDRILYGSDYPIISEFEPDIDENLWYKNRLYQVKAVMSDEVFKKITNTNFESLFQNS